MDNIDCIYQSLQCLWNKLLDYELINTQMHHCTCPNIYDFVEGCAKPLFRSDIENKIIEKVDATDVVDSMRARSPSFAASGSAEPEIR